MGERLQQEFSLYAFKSFYQYSQFSLFDIIPPMNRYDLIVIGSGAAGMMAAITAAREKKSVLLLEKLPKLGVKLKATGGGRCNLTNTLSNEEFMNSFGRNGKFMFNALRDFDHNDLINFFREIGVETHAPDGFRVFPKTHNSLSILNALENELEKLNVEIKVNERVTSITEEKIVKTETNQYKAENVIIATGGLGYPQLGADEEGFNIAKDLEHKVTDLFPAMTPLISKESWIENCRADTISKVEIRVDIKKHKKLKQIGDLIFTKNGIRGPVVLDFAREITPLISKYGEVPLLMNLTKMNSDEIFKHLQNNSELTILESIKKILPEALAEELIKLAKANRDLTFKKQEGVVREELVKVLTWTPLTIIGTDGFKTAMVTRGGVSLKEVKPETMESKLHKGIYFCGEVLDLDGPCGGYNLQWSFSSGFLAGLLR